MEGAISSSSLNRCDYISGQSGGPKEGRRQEVTAGEIRGDQIMTSGEAEAEQSRRGLSPLFCSFFWVAALITGDENQRCAFS